LHLIERDHPTGMMRIKECVFGMMPLWDGPDFRPDRRSCSKDSGYSSSFLKCLGKDCSGLVNPAPDRIQEYKSDLEHSRTSDEYRRIQVEEIIRSVKAKRAGGKAA
jgi:hypothetical protein